MSETETEEIEQYAHFWGADRNAYVLMPVRLPDGRLFHDIYALDGTYMTLPDEAVNAALVERMRAAGTPVIDPDTWIRRGRDLANHSHLWTTARNRFVILRQGDPSGQPCEQIYGTDGELYELADELHTEVVERMSAAGVRMVDPVSLVAVVEDEAKAQDREGRLWRSCFPRRIPKRWRRHRVDLAETEEDPPVSSEADFTGEYLVQKMSGALPFAHVRSFHPELIAQLQPGDELWWYRSPQRCWDQMAGRAGYCIVRNGRSIAHAVSILS